MVLRWGIVTAGKISNDFVNSINFYPGDSNMVVAAVAARNQDKAKEFAVKHKIAHVLESYAALAVSKEIDVAYIGALNPDHYELTKLFLENGKHVLCEKPLCMNEKQVRSLVNLAHSKQLFLMEAIWSRFFPSYITLDNDIKNGKLGEVLFVEANFGVPISSIDRLRLKDLGGSAVLDIGVYLIQFAQFVFKDEPISVTARGELNEQGVDVVATIILEYSGGRKAVLNAHGKIKLWNKATVVGTKGRVTLNEPFHAPLELVDVDGKTKVFQLPSSESSYNFDNSSGLVYEALEVKRCIDQGLLESPQMSHKESIIIAKIEDEIRRQLGVQYDVDNKEFN